MYEELPLSADDRAREDRYAEVAQRLVGLLQDPHDWITAMATVACELHHAFGYYDWTGFYRAVTDQRLFLGPYQGPHGCLAIDFSRGVCGAAARTRTTQLVADVEAYPGHIACSASTRSELVVPIVTPGGRLLGVLDVDSNALAAFRDVDVRGLEALCQDLGRRFQGTPSL